MKHRRPRRRAIRIATGGAALAVLIGTIFVGYSLARSPDHSVVSGPGTSSTVTASTATATTAPATTTTEASTTTAPPRSATIVVGGDLLAHPSVVAAARTASGGFDFAPLLAPIKARVSAADLAICHLETVLSASDHDLSGYPRFRVPHEMADAIAATGFGACSTASNHALDFGFGGVVSTLDALDAAGVEHVGTARTADEAAQVVIDRIGGIAVGQLAYSYGFNGAVEPKDEPWAAAAIDASRIIDDARRLRAAGAEFVVVSLHWGEEYQQAPTATQQTIAEQLAASGAVDLVVGTHVHVVQPVTRIGRMWVIYGLGNLLSGQSGACCPAATQDGVLVRVRIGDTSSGLAVTDVAFTPTFVVRPSLTVVPVADALADPATPPSLRAELEHSWARTTGAMLALDGAALGVHPDLVPRQ